MLAYRADLRRAREFRPDRARKLGVPVEHWQFLRRGGSVSWEGAIVEPDDVLGPERPGLSVAYVTDTRPLPRLGAFVAGADLLVCEGTYGDDSDAPKAERNRHLTFREAAVLARVAGAKRLWITHFSPGLDDPQSFLRNATEVFPGAVVGHDGLTTGLVFPAS